MAREPFHRTEIFHYKGQPISIPCIVYPWGDATQMVEFEIVLEVGKKKKVKFERFLPGCMWRPNKDLARESKGATERQCYPAGAYSLLRSGLEAIHNYGLIKFAPGTELAEIEGHKLAVRRSAIEVMTRGGSIVDLEALAKEHNDPLIRELDPKRNIRKKMARQNLQRGTVPVDSLGRRNPRVMAAATEAALGNLNRRIDAMKIITSCLDARSRGIAGIIYRVRALYRQLRLQFDPHYATIWQAEDAGMRPKNVQVIPGWLQRMDNPKEWPGIDAAMARFINDFMFIQEKPFYNNVRHMRFDALGVRRAIGESNHSDFRVGLERMLEGTRWFFALDHLEQRVIFPLSLLMADLRRRERARRRITKEKGKFKITHSLAPAEFDMIARSFSAFVKKLAWKKDGELAPEMIANPVRPRIKPLLRAIFAAMREDDWIKVKRNLIKIEAIL